MRDPQAEPADLIRSVSRALRVLESVGATPRGLTVKQIARRCELTVATTYHLVRTLAYEGYVVRRDDGTYGVGLEISDRYRELVEALRAPDTVVGRLRRATQDSGYSYYVGRFVSGRIALTTVVEGPRSPYLEDLVPGFDDGAHATALGKALLATMRSEERARYVREVGMRMFTRNTLDSVDALEADLVAGERRGMFVELGQYRPGVACASVIALPDRDPERRIVLAVSAPLADLTKSAGVFRTKLADLSKDVATLATASIPPRLA
ncbi:MAG TPA: helix-turn-helix domain-containing protein [Micromonosporaceae bacterium]|nr:helix-turn-helix domain-containing protein [Micromonosporaceae bacterium]